VFAGSVALWLASRDRRIDLQLTATLGRESDSGAEPSILFSVRNAGRRKVTLTAIGFSAGLFTWLTPRWGVLSRGGTYVLPNQTGVRLRYLLDDAEIYEYSTAFHPLIFNLADALPRPYWLSQWTVRFFVLTSVDTRPSARVSARLRRRIVRAARRRETT
jgi:hypothetical protein